MTRDLRTGHGLVLAALAGALCWLAGLYGCGASALEESVRAHAVLTRAHTMATRDTAAHIRQSVRDECGQDEACVRERVRTPRRERAAAGINAAATKLDVARDALLEWARAGTNEPPRAVCSAMRVAASAVLGALELAQELGADVPSVDDVADGLLGAMGCGDE